MSNSSRPFALATHDVTASSIRELVNDDPALDEIGGADGEKICCFEVSGKTYCGRDIDV